MPSFFNWPQAGPAEDQFRSLVNSLRDGRLVGIPTDAGYVVVRIAANSKLDEVAQRFPDGVQVRYVNGLAELPSPLPGRWEQVLDRIWPGPLGVSFSSKSIRYRSPRHAAASTLLSAVNFGLVAWEPLKPATTPAELAERFGANLDVLVDSGPVEPNAVTWISADDGWRIERLGHVDEAAIRDAAGVRIVFVCTGNTCRSPMAEAIFRRRLADRLGCLPAELPARGYQVRSAGVSAYPGDAATVDAAAAALAHGGDLSEHRSQPLTMDMVARADHLIAMTRGHLLAILSRYPQISGSMRLLCGADGDLDDPIGGPEKIYADCARVIDRHLSRFLEELVR